MMTDLGKRQLERFDLNVPAFITLEDSNSQPMGQPMEFRTRNVCAGGAFLVTETPLKTGTRVDVDLHLAFFTGNTEYERRSDIRVSGSVIRVDPDGMAIQFDDKFQIFPVPKNT